MTTSITSLFFEIDTSVSFNNFFLCRKHLRKMCVGIKEELDLMDNQGFKVHVENHTTSDSRGNLCLYLGVRVDTHGACAAKKLWPFLDTLRAKIKNSPSEAFKDRANIRTLLTWANQEPTSPHIPGTSEYVGGVVSIKYRLEDLPKPDLGTGDSTEPLQNVAVMTKFRDVGYLSNTVLDSLVINLNRMLKKHRRYTEEYTYLVEADYMSQEVKWLIQFPKKEPGLQDSVFAERCLVRMRELQSAFVESFRHIYSEDSIFKAVHKWMYDKTFCQNNSQFLKHGSISNVYVQRT